MKSIHRIVITGGPCAGKTTAFARIEAELSKTGYKVFFVPETFTQMYQGGIKLLDYSSLDFQSMLLKQQIATEDMYFVAAQKHKNDKVVILYDRGVMDPFAYMSSSMARMLIDMNGYRDNTLRSRYDAVIHMVTAADGAEEAYLANKANNKARYESVEEAKAADKALISVWTGHSHLRIIDNSTDFDNKITKVIEEIYSIIGEPTPLEIEKKYLVKMPDIEVLKEKVTISSSNILQTYLCEDGTGFERRIRQRGNPGDYIYYYTEKKRVSEIARLEKESIISEKEYLELLSQSDYRMKQIRKTRYCFVWNKMYFELDVYPFWDNCAILEVELTSENDAEVEIPDFIEIIKDVTEDEAYKNYYLATRIPE